ncbi:MAG: NUDIX domain-containing protein [Bacteroidaceae bacterium]|nr:NUDIX domain-containing protein [Bacteroidaceae bacterium]
MTNYSSYPRFFVSVDCVIFGFKDGKLKVLIHKRPYEPGLGEQSLIGGFVQRDENLENAVFRILKEFTGLDNVYIRQLAAFGEVERDPGERVISVVYYVLINFENYKEELTKEHNATWVDVNELPKLCFDHNEMVEKARKELGEDIKNTPVAGKLLPRYFTLTQLQTLHESIQGQLIDKRNFRRSISDKDYIQATDMIDKVMSRRGATLYEFK